MEDYLKKMFEEGERVRSEQSNYSTIKFFTIKDGQNKYRIVPLGGNLTYKIDKHFGKHFGVLTSKGKGGVWICSMSKYGSCPFCEEYAQAKKIGEDKANMKRASSTYMMYAVDETGQPGILQLDTKAYGKLTEFIETCVKSEDFEHRNVVGFETGSYLIITKTKKRQGDYDIADYSFIATPKQDKMTEEEAKKVFQDFPPLEEVNRSYTPDELKKVLVNDFSFMKKESDTSFDYGANAQQEGKAEAKTTETKAPVEKKQNQDQRISDLEEELNS